MGLFDNCLLACDIDGTLVADEYINPKNIEKIEYFMSEGGCFSLSTGRSVGAVSVVLDALKRVSPSVVANGCMLYDFENQKMLYDVTLPASDHRMAQIISNSGLDVGAEIHCGEDVYTLRRNAATDLHQAYEKLQTVEITFEKAEKLDWHKVVYMFKTAQDREKIKKMLKDEESMSSFTDTCAVINGKTQYYYEQVPKGVSKASALEKLCEILKIKQNGLFAIGDYYNDLQMLKAADVSAAPSDSPVDIQEAVDFIAVDCRDGAVADFIDYLAKVFKPELALKGDF